LTVKANWTNRTDNEVVTDSAFRLGPWLVQPTHHRIRCTRTGSSQRLEPRLMRLLCLLAARPGAVLTRQQLLEALWPRCVVTENSLTRAISDLRRQLQHPELEQSPIETIPRQGYCLRQSPGRNSASQSAMTTQRWRFVWPGMAMVLLLPFMLLWQKHAQPGDAASDFVDMPIATPYTAPVADRVQSNQGPDMPHHLRLPALSQQNGLPGLRLTSPDGSLHAYVRYSDSGSHVKIAPSDANQPPLTVYSSDEFIHHLQWAPIGNALIFAISPKLNTASLLYPVGVGRLMIFDLEELQTREVWRTGGGEADDSGNHWNNDSSSMT
jgi:DNA-binding winged helix-turn-helix (wHTH) protein